MPTKATGLTDGDRFDVVIAGGGPVGMGLGIELGLRGITSLICDLRGPEQTFPARTNLTNGRSMEHFRRWGIADNLRRNDPVPPKFHRDVAFLTRANGWVLMNFEGGCEWRERLPISSEVPEWAPNQAIEKTLREGVEAQPDATMLFESTVTDFSQDSNGVEVAFEGPDGPRVVRGDYLVLADGARSSLRKRLNVGLPGQTLAHSGAWHFRAPELENLFAETHLASAYFFVNQDEHSITMAPQSGDGHWVYMVSPLPDGVDVEDWETLRQMLFDAIGAEFEIEDVRGGAWVSSSRMAPRYDFGRVFLAGDAAHLTSPFGGFGMNMGIGDAADLGWKLAAVLDGWGGPRLLETYTIERQEAEKFIIEGSQYNGEQLGVNLVKPHMEDEGEQGEAAREEVRELIVTEKTKEFLSLGAQFGYRYETSPIILGERSDPPPLDYGEYVPSARPGSRAPHLWLDDGSSLYDHFGLGFCLLKLGIEAETEPLEAAARERSLPLRVFELDSAEARELYEAALVLVRPDQHVAWRGDALPDDLALLLDTVRGALGSAPLGAVGANEMTEALSQSPTGLAQAGA
jgi:2-polyprenyl-6-methoxyphenol hydroxylase-like FAD-dependent oxidoreductase